MEQQTIYYGCRLYAHDTGDGWEIGVQDQNKRTVAILDWPPSWEAKSSSELEEMGYTII